MAQRRMFSLRVVDTDMFLDMSPTAQNLYFHLGMRADDDGFVSSPKKIMKMVGAPDDDYRVLVAKGFIIPMATNGVCVVSHWKVNNLIKNDRYTETMYKEEKARISEKDGIYFIDFENGSKMVPEVEPQDRLGKDRLGKDREEKILPPGKPEGSLSWLGTFNEKEEFVCGVPPETLKAFSEKYKASEDQIRNKCEDLVLWAQTSRKVKKNYKTFLQVILKKDFGIRTEADKILQERIDLTVGKSSPFAKSLAAKMKM